MEWYSPAEILRDYEVFSTLLWVSFGFALREQGSTVAYEWSVLSGQRRRRWIHLIYFTSKIAYWMSMCLLLVGIYTVHQIDCRAVAFTVKVFFAVFAASTSALLACRAAAVYTSRRSRRITISLLTVLGLGVAAAWIHQIFKVDAYWVKGTGKPWTEGSCIVSPIKATDIMAPSVTVTFDILVLIIVTYGLYSLEAEHTPVGRRLLRHNILYVTIIFILNAMNVGFCVADLNPIMSLINTGPTFTATMIVCTRLHIELAQSIGAASSEDSYGTGGRSPHSHSKCTGTAKGGSKQDSLPTEHVGPRLATKANSTLLLNGGKSGAVAHAFTGDTASLHHPSGFDQRRPSEGHRRASDIVPIEMLPYSQLPTPSNESPSTLTSQRAFAVGDEVKL
ncbi:hypothetical protein V8E36_006043 [Tilletia maclaganii]